MFYYILKPSKSLAVCSVSNQLALVWQIIDFSTVLYENLISKYALKLF